MTTLENVLEASIGVDAPFFLLNIIFLYCRDLLNTFNPPQNNFLTPPLFLRTHHLYDDCDIKNEI
jgi:hypothetical protein